MSDSYAVIQASLNNASSVGNAIVTLPPGTFKLTNYLSIPSNVILRGAGMNLTTLAVSAGFVPESQSTGAIVFTGVHDSGVEDLTLDGSLRTVNGIVFEPVNINTPPSMPMPGDAITGTNIPASTTVVNCTDTSPFTLTLSKEATGTGTVTATINGIAYTLAATTTGSRVITGATNTSNVNTHHCHARNCRVIGRPTTVQYNIWSRQAFFIDVADCESDGVTTAHDGTTDQNLLECMGGYQVKFVRNTLRRGANAGIALGVSVGVNNVRISDVFCSDNQIEGCWTGIQVNATHDTTYGNIPTRNAFIANNTVRNSERYGFYLYFGENGTTPASYLAWENINITNNLVDCADSFRDTVGTTVANSHYQRGIVWTNAAASTITNVLSNGCLVANNSFLYGGGGPSSGIGGDNSVPNYFYGLNGGIAFKNNNFGYVQQTNSSYSVGIVSCTDISFENNSIHDSGKAALLVQAGSRNSVIDNRITNYNTLGSGLAAVYWNSSNLGTYASNIMYGSNSQPWWGNGDGASTGMDIRNNRSLDAAYDRAEGFMAADESIASGASGTQTHLWGIIKPSAGATFTLTNARVEPLSIVTIQQIAGTAIPMKAVCTAGQIVFTGAFTGAEQFRWTISN